MPPSPCCYRERHPRSRRPGPDGPAGPSIEPRQHPCFGIYHVATHYSRHSVRSVSIQPGPHGGEMRRGLRHRFPGRGLRPIRPFGNCASYGAIVDGADRIACEG